MDDGALDTSCFEVFPCDDDADEIDERGCGDGSTFERTGVGIGVDAGDPLLIVDVLEYLDTCIVFQ